MTSVGRWFVVAVALMVAAVMVDSALDEDTGAEAT